MWKALGVGLIVLVASAGGAVAENKCGDEPIAPEIPGVADMKQKPPMDAATIRHGAFLEIRRWQGSLKSYRDCLVAMENTDKRLAGEAQRSDKPDADKIKSFQQEMSDAAHAFDASVDEEERTVNEFHAAQVAYCTRSDVDRSPCPKL
ncbi:MAG TPA: hypothetical protein VII49_00570 [Rhizomicrobium sp.]